MIKRDFHTLREDINSILEIPDRIKTLDIVHLKELIIHINKRKFDLLDFTNKFLMLNDNYTFEDRWLNNSQFGTTGVMLDNLEERIRKQIESISRQKTITPKYNHKIFDNLESEKFFNYALEEMVLDNKEPLAPMSYLFRQLWHKEKQSIETFVKEYQINCTIDEFISYCNTLSLLKPISKIKTYNELGIEKYKNSLKNLLEFFKNEKRV